MDRIDVVSKEAGRVVDEDVQEGFQFVRNGNRKVGVLETMQRQELPSYLDEKYASGLGSMACHLSTHRPLWLSRMGDVHSLGKLPVAEDATMCDPHPVSVFLHERGANEYVPNADVPMQKPE